MAIPHEYRGIIGAGSKAAGLIGIPGALSGGLDMAAVGGSKAAVMLLHFIPAAGT